MTELQTVNRLSRVGILGNILLSAFKLYAGIAGASTAMISDAVHSLSDVFATGIAWLGARLAQKPPDTGHPYGHERFECLASLALGCILALTGAGIGWAGLKTICTGAYRTIAIPTVLPLTAAVLSIAVKEGMFRYTMYYAGKLNSDVFRADAWHHRSDALSSVGSLIGIAAARLGFPVMEPAASVIICIFILKVAYDVLKDSVRKLLDTSCGQVYEEQLRNYICSDPDVIQIDLLHTRMFASKVYVDTEIAVDRNSTLIAAHNVAERVHHGIEKAFPEVKHVMVHVNPAPEQNTAQAVKSADIAVPQDHTGS